MSDDLEPEQCPSCGDYRNINTLPPINHLEGVENVDGGIDDFLQTWVRFHCDSCDTQIAVLESEVSVGE